MVTYIFVTKRLLIMRRDVFQAIADPVRREIIELLAQESLTVSAIADNFEISRPAVSKHIRILNECGLIEIDQKGRERFCEIKPSTLVPAFIWIEQYRNLWEEKIDSLETYLAKLQAKDKADE